VGKVFDREMFFAALADRTRLRLINLLSVDEMCVCFFVEVLGTNQPKISRHLAYLRRSPTPRNGFAELRLHPSRRDRHHDGLDGADLVVRVSFLPGDAKVVPHSGVAAEGQRRGQMDHQRRLCVEGLVVARRAVELREGPLLFLRQ
jgi:DNA-binding transcriptional ArsR family regulator